MSGIRYSFFNLFFLFVDDTQDDCGYTGKNYGCDRMDQCRKTASN